MLNCFVDNFCCIFFLIFWKPQVRLPEFIVLMADFVLTTQQTLIAHLCNMLQKPGEFETSREKYIWETTENNCRNETKSQTIND